VSGAAAFWDHTLAVYRKTGVGAACIGLQDRRGADVNILLFALWRTVSGNAPLDATALAVADQAVAPWRGAVVERLRAARNAIKDGIARAPTAEAEALRKAIIGQEIEGERIAQSILAAAPIDCAPSTGGATDAAASLLAYARFLGFAPDAQDRADFRTLLTAAFPDADPASIDRALL
jgi:uncharacterized protein (TIGR02444 family)